MTDQATSREAAQSVDQQDGDLALQLEQHRVRLTGYCYRMLGSAFE